MNNDSNFLEVENITDNVLIVSINETYKEGMPDKDVFEISRQAWSLKSDIKKRDVRYVIAVHKFFIKGVYAVSDWHKDELGTNRWVFEGSIASEDILKKYAGKQIKDWKLNNKIPFRYVNC